MARPAYMVFSQSGAVDQATNSISFFNVIEGIEGRAHMDGQPVPPGASLGLNARLAAVWMKEEGDTPDVSFDGDITCTAPSGAPVFVGMLAPFSFAADIHFHRITVQDLRLPGMNETGTYIIEARLRRTGQTEWIARQTFPFRVSATPPQAPAPTEPPSA